MRKIAERPISLSGLNLSVPIGKIAISRRLFYFIVASLIILNIIVPVSVYWTIQKTYTLARWSDQINYAQLFREHADNAANFINGTFFPWNNESAQIAETELTYAGSTMFYLGNLDRSHLGQLGIIANIVLESSSVFYQITPSHRVSFSTNLRSLGDKIVFAYYSNYLNYYPAGQPNLWYFGPSPPDEGDLRDASTIAANLTR